MTWLIFTLIFDYAISLCRCLSLIAWLILRFRLLSISRCQLFDSLSFRHTMAFAAAYFRQASRRHYFFHAAPFIDTPPDTFIFDACHYFHY